MSIYKNAITVGVIEHGYAVQIQLPNEEKVAVEATKDLQTLYRALKEYPKDFELVFLDKQDEPVVIIIYVDDDCWLLNCDEDMFDIFDVAFV